MVEDQITIKAAQLELLSRECCWGSDSQHADALLLETKHKKYTIF
jgi:hypothetical protein